MRRGRVCSSLPSNTSGVQQFNPTSSSSSVQLGHRANPHCTSVSPNSRVYRWDNPITVPTQSEGSYITAQEKTQVSKHARTGDFPAEGSCWTTPNKSSYPIITS
ncbi:hypothetical protein BV898_19951 [Hypsibius exemplaris]|uniref:Uncharacterized protein n=1 Tax=Hypsibius exemplaris TaxID=2072580 RepID=A0A9X6RPY8_HYPEX|nr:hypothetical protein BV898_19951 [Hypsibius exemplaris]